MARAYFYGRGVKINKGKAIELVDKAIEYGYEEANELRDKLLGEM